MAELRSQDKRDKLRLIYAQCKPAGLTLQASLMAALTTCDAAINGATPGTWLSSSQEAGGGASFQALHDYTPVVAKRLIGELLDAYDQSVIWLQTYVTGGVKPTDAQIYTRLMTVTLLPIRRFRSDFTGARYGIGYYTGVT